MTKVMFVDDEALLALSAEMCLQGAGYVVEIAFDGQDALQRAASFKPDIVITDYMMPGLDGVGLARALPERGLRVPIILLTAVPERDLPNTVRDLFTAYISKPVRDELLLSCIAGLVEKM